MNYLSKLIICFLLAGSVGAATFPSDWGRRVKFTVDADSVDASAVDFSVLIDASMVPAEIWMASGDSAQTDGDDIRFATTSAGTTLIPFDRVAYSNTDSTCEFWVAVPSISSSVDTDFWMFYNEMTTDSVADSDANGRDNCWDSDYTLVSHKEDDPDVGGVDEMINSVAGSNHGQASASMTTSDMIDGQIGVGYDFDGNSDHVWWGDRTVWADSGDMTYSFWFQTFTTTDNGDLIVSIEDGPAGELEVENAMLFLIMVDNLTQWDFTYIHEYSTGANESNMLTAAISTDSVWINFHIVRDNATDSVWLYKNGIESDKFEYTNDPTLGGNTSIDFAEAERINTSRALEGALDESRLSTAVRTPEWIHLEYTTAATPGVLTATGTAENNDAAAAAVGQVIMIGAKDEEDTTYPHARLFGEHRSWGGRGLFDLFEISARRL